MPNESLNLYLSIQSGNSEETLVSLTDKTRVLDKETQELKQTTEGFANSRSSGENRLHGVGRWASPLR